MILSFFASLMAAITGMVGGSWAAQHYINRRVQENIERRMGIRDQRRIMLEKKANDRRQKKLMPQNEAMKRPMTRNLYVAGVRSKDEMLLIEAGSQLALIVPILLFFFMQVSGQISTNNLLLLIFTGAVCVMGPKKWIEGKKKSRQQNIEFEIPQFMDLMVIAVESGVGLVAAITLILDQLGDKTPLTQEFNVLQQEYHGGVPLAEACDRMTKRCEVPTLSLVMGNIVQSERMGTSLGETLRVLASELREKHKQNLREKAQKIPNLILLPTSLVFLSLMIVTMGPTVYGLMNTFAEMGK